VFETAAFAAAATAAAAFWNERQERGWDGAKAAQAAGEAAEREAELLEKAARSFAEARQQQTVAERLLDVARGQEGMLESQASEAAAKKEALKNAWSELRVASGDAESLRGALARAKADHAEALLKERVTREEAEQVFAEAGELHAGQQAQLGAALRARGAELSAAATALEESAAKAAQLAEDLARLEGLQAEAMEALQVATGEKADLAADAVHLRAEADALRTAVAEKERDLDNLQVSAERDSDYRVALEADLEEALKAKAELETALAAASKAAAKAKAEGEKDQAEAERRSMKMLADQEADLSADLAVAAQEIRELRGKLAGQEAAAEASLNAREAELEETQGKLKRLEGLLAAQAQDLGTAERQMEIVRGKGARDAADLAEAHQVIRELQKDSLAKTAALKDAKAEAKAAAVGLQGQKKEAAALTKGLATATKMAEKAQTALQAKVENLKKAEERNKVLREQKQKVNAKVKEVQERNRKLSEDNKVLRQENREVKRTAKDRLAAELQALGVQLKAAEEKERESRESFAAAEVELAAEAHRAEQLQAQMQEQAEALAALRREMGDEEGSTGPSLPDTPKPEPVAKEELSKGEQEKQEQSA
jgi:hypothetical protein